MIVLSHRKYPTYTLSLAESCTSSHIHSHCHTPNFFSLLGDSPQPWSHEATGWGVKGRGGVGNELCGQHRGHRMEGPRGCLMKEAQEGQAREQNPKGAGKGTGGSSRAVAPTVCASTGLSPPVGTSITTVHPETRESEAKACVYFGCYCLGEYETATARETLDKQTCRGGGSQTNRYPSGGGPGSDRRSGRQADGGCLKGNRQFGDPVLPRFHHRSRPPPPTPRAPGRPVCPPGPVLVAPCAAAQPSRDKQPSRC